MRWESLFMICKTPSGFPAIASGKYPLNLLTCWLSDMTQWDPTSLTLQ